VQGAIEVFGQAADVIIANPNGLTVNGAEFINTNDASFVTGLVSVQNNEVIFDVTGGALIVQRDGISGSQNLNLVGRTVGLDGLATASGSLTISGGAQRFNATTGVVTGQAGQGPAPDYAVDGTAFGAARAGDITILGNEAGLGVRLPGSIQSEDGDLNIMSLDDIDFNALGSTGDINLIAEGDITQQSDAAALGAINVEAGGSFTASEVSGIFSGEGTNITAAEDVVVSGEGQITTNLNIAAGQDAISSAEIVIGESVNFEAGRNVNIEEGALSAQQVTVLAEEEAVLSDVLVNATDTIEVSGQDVTLGEFSILQAQQGTTLTAEDTFTNGTSLIDATDVDITFGRNFVNAETGQFVFDDIDIALLGNIDNAGLLFGRNSLSLDAAEISNSETGVIAGGSVALSADNISSLGLISADADLIVNAGSELFNAGQLQMVSFCLWAAQ